MKITPILYAHRPDSRGLCNIAIRITINKKRIYKPTGDKVPVDAWNKDKVRPSYPNAALINSKIEKMKADLRAELLKEELQDKEITYEVVKSKLGPKKRKHDFYSYCEKLIKEWEGKKEASTLSKYSHELSKLSAFAPKLEWADITPEWLSKYERYLREKLNNESNTIWRSFKQLKTFFNAAIKADVIKDYPFDKYDNPKYKGGQRVHLTDKELKAFRDQVVNGKLSPADRIAGYFFLFSCATGLRYSDCEAFRSDKHIIEGKRIWLRTTKTGEDVSIILTDRIKEALQNITEGKMPTNQECNRALKVIAEKAEIKKDLTFHAARHTFGYSCAGANVPIEVAAKLMGHTNTKVTSVYYHLSNANVDQWMMKLHES